MTKKRVVVMLMRHGEKPTGAENALDEEGRCISSGPWLATRWRVINFFLKPAAPVVTLDRFSSARYSASRPSC